MGIMDLLFGKSQNLKEELLKGAKVVDVRTPAEFQGGHVKGSINIPLNTIASNELKLKEMNAKIIFCCASGGRSGQATSMMKQKGVDCMNGGSWLSVNSYEL
jgi:rhodanese-related sulfurtransferase